MANEAKIKRLEAQRATARHFLTHGLAEHPSAARGLTAIELEQLAIQQTQTARLLARLERKIQKLRTEV